MAGALRVAMVGAGYFFGSLPFVEKNFSLVMLAIVFISILPGVIAWIAARWLALQIRNYHETTVSFYELELKAALIKADVKDIPIEA